MRKFYVGQKVRIGGKLGPIMTISEIHGKDMVLTEPSCTFYYHEGDCTLIPIREVKWVQIPLFEL